MNTKTRLLLVLICLLPILASCSSQPTQAVLPDCEALGQAILESQTFTEEMMPLNESKLLKALDLTGEEYEQAYMAMDASRATAEAIIVITAKDQDSAKTIAEKLEAYRSDTLRQYQDYRPEESPKLENATVLTQGVQCVLAFASDQAAVQQVCNTTWGK